MNPARSGLLAAILLLGAGAAGAGAQIVVNRFLLVDGDAVPDHPFGITLHPDGRHAYVSVCGNYITPSQNNRRLLRMDLWQGTIVGQALVGLFPEDIGLLFDATGALRHVMVTASSGSRVDILDPGLGAVAQVPLPACPLLPSQFPFGIAVAADSSRAIVTTLGGCGNVFVLDTDPASPTFATVTGNVVIPDGHGRPALLPSGEFLVPGAAYGPGLGLSYATVARVSPAGTGSMSQLALLTPPTLFVYAFLADAVVSPSGKALAILAGAPVPSVLEIDPPTLTVTRTFPLPVPAMAQLHGLCLDPSGEVAAICVLDADRVIFLDTRHGNVLGQVATGSGSNPNQAVFTKDGRSLFVTLQGRQEIAEIGRFPWKSFSAGQPATPPGTIALRLRNGVSAQPFLIGASMGLVPTGLFGLALDSPIVAGQGTLDLAGAAEIVWPSPPIPGSVYVQAFSVDRTLRVLATAPLTATWP